MPNMEQLKIQLLSAQAAAAALQSTINDIVRPRDGAPVPVQALCAVCTGRIFSNDALFTGGSHYHNNCYKGIQEAFTNGR